MQTLQEVHSPASWLLHHPFSSEDQAAATFANWRNAFNGGA